MKILQPRWFVGHQSRPGKIHLHKLRDAISKHLLSMFIFEEINIVQILITL